MSHQAYNKRTIVVPDATVTAAETQSMSMDTAGSEEAVIRVHMGTCATTSVAFSTLAVVESETITSPSSMESIVALTGGTETSTSAGFVTPTSATMENGGTAIEFNLDLKKRKRYVGVTADTGQSIVMGMEAQLGRLKESVETAAEKSGSNLTNTDASGCATLITL